MFYGYVAISKVLKDKRNWKRLLPLISEIDFSKNSSVWFGKVIKSPNEKFSIINTTDSRQYIVDTITEKVESLIEQGERKLIKINTNKKS